jgi:RNA polymerase sigma factor (sigma-70 family)
VKDDAVLLDGFLALVAWIAVRIRKSNPHVSFGELFMAGTGARITRTGKSTGALGALDSYKGDRDGLPAYVGRKAAKEMWRLCRGRPEVTAQKRHVSIDAGGKSPLHERLCDQGNTTLTPFAVDELGELFGRALDTRERFVVARYHLDDSTLEDIGKAIGVSAERVRQINTIALRKLQAAAEALDEERSREEPMRFHYDPEFSIRFNTMTGREEARLLLLEWSHRLITGGEYLRRHATGVRWIHLKPKKPKKSSTGT